MRINLLPPEIRQRQRIRRQTGAVAALGVVLVGLVGGFFVLQQLKLSGLEEDLAEQEQVNAGLRSQITELRQFDELQQELIATRQLLDELLVNEVRWSGILRDISLVIPGNVWLTNLNGTLGTTGATGTTGTDTGVEGVVGQISVNGFGLAHRAVALWLTRLEDIEAFANPWVSNSAKTTIGAVEVVQFTSTVDLTQLAQPRQGGGAA